MRRSQLTWRIRPLLRVELWNGDVLTGLKDVQSGSVLLLDVDGAPVLLRRRDIRRVEVLRRGAALSFDRGANERATRGPNAGREK